MSKLMEVLPVLGLVAVALVLQGCGEEGGSKCEGSPTTANGVLTSCYESWDTADIGKSIKHTGTFTRSADYANVEFKEDDGKNEAYKLSGANLYEDLITEQLMATINNVTGEIVWTSGVTTALKGASATWWANPNETEAAAEAPAMKAAVTASTELTAPVTAIPETSTVEVAATTGFEIGDKILIDAGTAAEEENVIIGFGSMLLQSPLKFDHPIGAVVEKLSGTGTTTLTPWDSSASSVDSTPLESSYSSSFKEDSSGDSSGSGHSSGSTASGSSGSYMQIWQWCILALLLCACCAGAAGAAMKSKPKPKKKKAAPQPEPVPEEEVLLPPLMPMQAAPVPVTTAYTTAAPVAQYAPTTTAYAAAPAAYAPVAQYAPTTYAQSAGYVV